MIHKRHSSDGKGVIVTFEIPGSVWADRIHLVGNFNDWDPESLPFRYNRQDDWQAEVELEQGRQYRFRYLVDGDHWRSDRHADRYVVGADGSYDSVVIAQLPWVG